MPDTFTDTRITTSLPLGAKVPQIQTSSPAMDEAASGMLAETRRLGEALPAKQAKVEAARAEVGKELDQPLPGAPKLQDVPQYQPRQVSKDDMLSFMGLASALAALGTKAMRGDATMALNAAASAMKGFQEGNIQQTKLDVENFNTKMKGVIAENRKITDQYKAIIEDRKLSLAQKQQKLAVAAAERDDEITLSAIRTGNLKSIFDLEAHRIQASNQAELRLGQLMMQYEMSMGRLEVQREIGKMRSGMANISPEDVKSMGAQVASGMPVSQVVPGYGGAAVPLRMAARAAAVEQIMRENPGMTAEAAGRELAMRQIDYTSGKSSIMQLNKMLGATRQAISQLDFNVKKTTEAMDKLEGSDISPVINAIARGVQKWTGDPAYSELFFYMHASAMESARILSGGQASVAQLHEGARQEALQWANINMTPESWKKGVAPAMLAEGQNRLQNFEQAIEAQRAGTARPGAAPQQPVPMPTKELTPAETQELQQLRKRFGRGS